MIYIMNSTGNQNNFIKDELQAIRSGSRRSPFEIGRLLVLIEQNEYWSKEGAKSFTDWVIGRSHFTFSLGPTMVWSYHRAARTYDEYLRPKLISWGMEAPPLEELADHISPESFDLLRRIELAASEDKVRSLAQRIFEGTIKRAELRYIWTAYRDVVKDNPQSRGRISFDNAMKRQPAKVFQAEALNALNKRSNWLAMENIALYKIMRLTRHQFPGESVPEALLVIKRTGGALEIHGLAIKTVVRSERMLPEIEAMAPYFDRIWVVVSSPSSELNAIPSYVGVVQVKGEEIIVLRKASQSQELGGHVLDLARVLLAMSIK